MSPLSDDLVNRLGRWSAGRGPLHTLLAARLGRLIDDGELPPSAPLPPDRVLADALSVGRTTVVAAYDLLRADGKIVRRQGSGTVVAGFGGGARPRDTTEPIFRQLMEPPENVSLLICAAPDAAPPELIEAYQRAVLRISITTGDIGYHPAGHPALRQALAERFTGRGLRTGADQILVTTGAQQALYLLARTFVDFGDPVVVEAPTYPGMLDVLRETEARILPVPVGPDGMDLDAFGAVLRRERPALVYSIPSYQNPTGSLMPPLARRRLVETVVSAGVPLIDDEALGDLGFADDPRPPLASFDDAVITVGSLSKVAWGGSRVGWVRGPASLIRQLARFKAVHDLGSEVFAQLAAVELMSTYASLRRRRVAELRLRHDHLRAELGRLLPTWHAPPVQGGQTLWIRLPYRTCASSFAQTALRYSVALLPGNSLDISGQSSDYLRIPFIAPPADLTEAVERLAKAWSAA